MKEIFPPANVYASNNFSLDNLNKGAPDNPPTCSLFFLFIRLSRAKVVLLTIAPATPSSTITSIAENKSVLERSGANFMKIGFMVFTSNNACFAVLIICFSEAGCCKSLKPEVLGELIFMDM